MEASGSKVLQSSWFQCQELEWKATNSEKTTLEIKVFRVFNCDTHSWGWGVPLGCGTPRSGFPSAIWCFYVHQRQVQRGTERLNQTGFVWLPHLIIKSPGRNNNSTYRVWTDKCISLCKGLLRSCYKHTRVFQQCYSWKQIPSVLLFTLLNVNVESPGNTNKIWMMNIPHSPV